MNWFVLLFLGTTGAVIVATCIVVLLVLHRFNRHHRVDRRIATPAPVTAVVDPRTPARLHRRLARAAHTADDIAERHRPASRRGRRKADVSVIVQLAEEVKAHAVDIDDRIAVIARLAPADRNREVRRLGGAVREIEQAVAELARVSADSRAERLGPDATTGVASTRERIGQLAAALRDLDRVDADNGLHTADPSGRPVAPPPPPPPPAVLPADSDRAGRLPPVPPVPSKVEARRDRRPVRPSPADR